MRWTDEEINFLTLNYKNMKDLEISIKLNKKVETVTQKRIKLGLKKQVAGKLLKICKNCNKKYYVNNCRKESEFCCIFCIREYQKKTSGSIRICKICGKEYYAKGNPKTNNVCSKKCSAINRMNGKIIKCSNCGKDIYKNKKSKKLFCSKTCASEYQKIGKIKLSCKFCNKEFLVYPSTISNTEKKGWKISYCSNKCRLTDPENKIRLLKLNEIQNRNKSLNKLEIYGSKILNDLMLEHETQYLINGKICVDVFIPKYNLIIQWWGDYWHGHPTKLKNNIPDSRQKKRMILDISQQKYLNKCGFTLLTFWENEIYNNIEYVKNKINDKIK